MPLQPGDFIIAFSDGVTEALNEAGEEYIDDRLLASIERHRGLRARGPRENLLADVHSFAGAATPNDDRPSSWSATIGRGLTGARNAIECPQGATRGL